MKQFDSFRKLELSLAVEDIRLKGKQLWPYLRIYFADWLIFEKDRRITPNKKMAVLAVRSLFYGFFNFFRSYDYLVFSSANNRKPVDGKQVARADFLDEAITSKSLYIELPFPGHFKRSEIPTRHIVSRIILYVLEKMVGLFISSGSIANEHILQSFKKELEIKVDHRGLAKRFLAQHRVACLLMAIYRPKIVFAETAYSMIGYVLAFREKGIRVIEFQHGTINRNHYAYYVNKAYDPSPFPTSLLTFGRGELSVFDESNYFISRDDVYPIGSFYIEHMAGVVQPVAEVDELRGRYRLLVGIAGQDPHDHLLMPFIKTAAEKDDSIGYIHIPRYKKKEDYASYGLPGNVHFIPNQNFHQLIVHMDYHCTINSTTALEAPSLGVKNIMLNIENRARNYFEALLTDERTTVFVNTPDELVIALHEGNKLGKRELMAINEQHIEPGFRDNLDKVVKELTQ